MRRFTPLAADAAIDNYRREMGQKNPWIAQVAERPFPVPFLLCMGLFSRFCV